jgi:RNA polymerase sigma-70 factor, ECF subfamily
VGIRCVPEESYGAAPGQPNKSYCNENVTFSYPAANTSMDSGSNLDTLMARYQAGDFAAVTALVERIGPQLHRFFMAQSARRSDADDLLQETWLRIHRVRHTYRPGEPVLPWFYAIARRVRIDHYRKASRTTAREQRLEEVSDAAATLPPEESRADDLEAILAPLSESQREVIRMMKVAGMSLEEVARATSCSVGSVKQKVHRAYGVLRDAIGRKGFGGGLP